MPISKQAIKCIGGNKTLRGVLNKLSLPPDRQIKILQALERGFDRIDIEKFYLRGKKNLERTEALDLDRIARELPILLDNVPIFKPLLTEENKKLCKDTIKEAIRTEQFRRDSVKIVKIFAEKRTVASSKSFKAYTILIKELVDELNPMFRHKIKDRGLPRVRREEKTFQAVANILNITFPKLDFSPQQVKARYHK